MMQENLNFSFVEIKYASKIKTDLVFLKIDESFDILLGD